MMSTISPEKESKVEENPEKMGLLEPHVSLPKTYRETGGLVIRATNTIVSMLGLANVGWSDGPWRSRLQSQSVGHFDIGIGEEMLLFFHGLNTRSGKRSLGIV